MKTRLNTEQLKNKLPAFYGVIANDLQATEEYIADLLRSENPEIEEAALSLLNSGGKRLRPGILLLSGYCGSYDREKLIPLAAAMEIIHMASLVHDDIVDKTPIRRGKPTIPRAKGSETALLTGNFMLTKAMDAVLEIGDERIRKIATDTALEMCRGEFLQLQVMATPDFSTEHYLRRVRRKTANLIATAAEIGAYVCEADETTVTAMREFGENAGIAFQITDDILDYTAKNHAFGKAVGSDLAEGLATMPLICAWQNGNQKSVIRDLFRQSRTSKKAVAELIALVEENDGTKAAARMAEEYIQKAKTALLTIENDAVRAGFEEIADFILKREH